MKRFSFIALLILTLTGCDKDSTEVKSDDKLRLSISAFNNIWDTEFSTNKKDFDLTIKLYEDSINAATGKKESNHIGVNTSGILTLELDEKSYDLFEYYLPGSVLGGDGSYVLNIPDIENSVKSLTINLLLNGKKYRVDSLMPAPVLVTNHAHLAQNYEPLDDDFLIEWESSVLPTKIEGTQTVFFKDQQVCSKDIYTFAVPTDTFSHYIYKEDMNHGCENMTQDIRDIRTEVSLVQSEPNLQSTHEGFDSVSVSFENNYKWLEVTLF